MVNFPFHTPSNRVSYEIAVPWEYITSSFDQLNIFFS